MLPLNGGKGCKDGPMQEAAPCEAPSCNGCENGEWAEWADWADCNVTCGGGTTARSRPLAKVPNACGTFPAGQGSQVAFCNLDECGADKDCEIGKWGPFTECDATCDGHQNRSRTILGSGAGNGKTCAGGTFEMQPCNPEQNQPRPAGCAPQAKVDCKAGAWEDWSACSLTCGNGQKLRRREIVQASKSGGAPCEGGLEEISECSNGTCPTTEAVDCKLSEWQDWTECYSDGQRARWKTVLEVARNGGKCEEGNTHQTEGCKAPLGYFKSCDWEDWGAYSDCSVSCGPGGLIKRSRTKKLVIRNATDAIIPADAPMSLPEDPNLMAAWLDAEELRKHVAGLRSQSSVEFMAAFSAGGAVLAALIVGSRTLGAVRKVLRRRTSTADQRTSAQPFANAHV